MLPVLVAVLNLVVAAFEPKERLLQPMAMQTRDFLASQAVSPSRRPLVRVSELVPSNSWAEVLRFGANHCTSPGVINRAPSHYWDGSPFAEGFSHGWPSDHGGFLEYLALRFFRRSRLAAINADKGDQDIISSAEASLRQKRIVEGFEPVFLISSF